MADITYADLNEVATNNFLGNIVDTTAGTLDIAALLGESIADTDGVSELAYKLLDIARKTAVEKSKATDTYGAPAVSTIQATPDAPAALRVAMTYQGRVPTNFDEVTSIS